MSPTKYKPHLSHCCCVPVVFCIRLTLCFFVFNKRMFFKWKVIVSSQSSLNSPWSLCKSLQAWTPAFLRCIRNLIQRWLNHLLFCSPHRKCSLPDHLNNRNKTQLHWIYYTILFLWAYLSVLWCSHSYKTYIGRQADSQLHWLLHLCCSCFSPADFVFLMISELKPKRFEPTVVEIWSNINK